MNYEAQMNFTIEQRYQIYQEISRRKTDALREHWKVAFSKPGQSDERLNEDFPKNTAYINENVAIYNRRISGLLKRANIYNLTETLKQCRVANRMALVWSEMINFATMDYHFGKFLMDDVAEVFENYQVIRCGLRFDDPYTKVMVTGKAFERGTCNVLDSETDQTFTRYTVKRADMAPIFLSAVEHIAWAVDGISIAHNAKQAQ